MTADELIDVLGGNQKVAAIAGVRPSAVSNWRKIGALPPRLYLRFARDCQKKGIKVPDHLFRVVREFERSPKPRPEAAA